MLTIDADWNVQADCPLYTKVPAEIRNRIFSYALSAFNNQDHPYQDGAHWCRPGYEYPQMLDTRVLQTCKQIYREYRLLPVTRHKFKSPQTGTGARFDILTEEQQHLVQKVHCFVQQYYLERWPSAIKKAPQGWPFVQVLTLTFRRSDWWSWESDEASTDRMGICPWLPGRTTREKMEAEPLDPPLEYIQSQMSQAGRIAWASLVANLARLEVLAMEFETEIRKKGQLDVVIERAKRWKFPRQDAPHLRWSGEIGETRWEGPAHPAGTGRPAAAAQAEPPKLTFVVTTLRFRSVKS